MSRSEYFLRFLRLYGRTFRPFPPIWPDPPLIAIQQSQPAATPQESRMQTIVNNITEPTIKLGTALVPGDTVELSGKHSVVAADGVSLFCYDDLSVTAIVRDAGYAVINVAVAYNP